MRRRAFLERTLGSSAAMALGPLALAGPYARAAIQPPIGRTLIHVMLLGAADLRFLFVPDPESSPEYAATFWGARRSIYQPTPADEAANATYAAVWANQYLPSADAASGTRFGIHQRAGWLKQQYDLGNVAIVCNVFGSVNRRHDHSQLIVQTGDPWASQYLYDRDGWGGRLVQALGSANVVSVTEEVAVYCNGMDPADRIAQVVHAKDTRNFGLSEGDGDPTSEMSATARALKAYYAQLAGTLASRPADWPYRRFLNHEAFWRRFGADFNARLAQVSPVQPAALAALYDAASSTALSNTKFGLQCANVHDAFLASDIFQQRVVSMEYTSWDTHNDQMNRLSANLGDVFGARGGLATLASAMTGGPLPDDVVFVFSSDFGRQLRANGDFGTDHGSGSYTILVGRGVRGGVYGEMFPASEIAGSAGETRFDQPGADIEGRTAVDGIYAAVCDWVAAGSGAVVFPDAATSVREAGVDLGRLFL